MKHDARDVQEDGRNRPEIADSGNGRKGKRALGCFSDCVVLLLLLSA